MAGSKILIATSIVLVGCQTAAPAIASEVEYCPPYGLMEQPHVDLEGGFFPFTIEVDDLAVGHKQVRLTGDVIKIDRATLGTLIRTASNLDARISKVIIDARVVRIDDSISFKDAEITIIADQVIFEPTGSVALLAETSGTLNISTRVLEVPMGVHRPFDFRPAKNEAGTSDFPADAKLLNIAAQTLIAGGQVVSPADSMAVLAQRFTLARLYDFKPFIHVQLVPSIGPAWPDRIAAEARWPAYSAAVWTSALRLSAFDPTTRAFLGKQINFYRPLFDRAPSASQAAYSLNNIAVAIDRNTDLQGNGAAWATSLPLSKLLDRVKGYADTGGDGRLRMNDLVSMLKAARDGANPDTTAMQNEAEASLQGAVTAYESANIRLGEIATALDAQKGLLDQLTQAYAARQQRLKDHAEDVHKGQQSRAQLVSALSTAASIATTAYTGNPALGAAAGGIIYAVGNAKTGKPVIDSLSAGWQFANAIKGPLGESAKAAEDLQASRKKYADFIESFTIGNITIKKDIQVPVKDPEPGKPATVTVKRSEALEDMSDKAKTLGESVKGLYDIYTKFVPDTPEIPANLEDDKTIKDLSSEIQVTLDRSKALTIELDALQRSGQEQQQTIANAAERLAALRSIDPTNEESRRSAVRYVIAAARDEIVQFADAMLDLRRLSLVEYAEPLPVDPEQLQRVLVLEETTPTWDPAQGLSEKDTESSYITLLERRRDAMQILAVRAAQAADTQFRSYVTRRGVQPIISYPEQELSASKSSPADERRFIALLNETILAEYTLIKQPRSPLNDAKLAELQARRLEVPFDIRQALRARYPIRLIQAAITAVKRDGTISGGDVSFSLEVERVGNYRHPMAQNGSEVRQVCFSVDLRAKESRPEQYYTPADFTIGDIDAKQTLLRTPAVSFWYLTSSDSQPNTGRTMFVSFPPAEARTYLSVRLDSRAAWMAPPVVKSLTVKAEVFE
jgi:predicted  nucleic acid-binding Zn-ribbon protein